MLLTSVKRLSKALRFRESIIMYIHNSAHILIASVMGADKLVFGNSINYFQWSISTKGFKMLWCLIKWLLVGSTNYVNTFCGQPISILVLRHFYWNIFIYKKLLFWLNFKALPEFNSILIDWWFIAKFKYLAHLNVAKHCWKA